VKRINVSSNESSGLRLDLGYIFRLLLAKSWIVLFIAVLVLLAAIAYIWQTPRIYESRAVIEVEQETPRVINIQEINPEEFKEPEALKTIEQAFLSDTLLLRVVKANGLEKDPLFAPPKRDGSTYLDSELVDRFRARVKVQLRRGTRLVDVTVQDRSAKRAQQLADSMIREFANENFEQKLNVSKTANDFLRDESARLKVKLQNAEEAVQKYREENNAVSLEDKQNIIVEKLRELNAKVTEAKGERLKLEADVATIRQGKVSSPEEMLMLPSVASLPVVVDLRNKLADKQSRYKAESQIRGLREALDRTLLNSGSMVVKSYEAAKNTEAKLTAALREQEQAALQLNKIAIPYNALVREVETDRALYESVLARMKETGIAKGIAEANIRVIESPLVAARPSKPSVLKILALALAAGLVLGCGVVFWIDSADSSVRSIDEVERISDTAVLTAVPESKRKNREKESVLMTDPGSYEAEAFRSLRTALSFLGAEVDRKTVLFTSANPAEGKTYCSFNYAVALAQTGLRTLLIDADLRRPDLSRFLMSHDGKGVTTCLSGRAGILECCQSTGIENLSILGAGSRASKPAEMLASGNFTGMIDEAVRHFDRVVVDSAPINAVSDTQLIVKNIESVCLVVRSGKVPRRAIARALSLLSQANRNPDGIVFNRMARRSRDGYYFSQYAGEYANAGGRSG
jgi:capsular exopolysaccharide synthesis family protein